MEQESAEKQNKEKQNKEKQHKENQNNEKQNSRKKTGLVLEGGGMRGIYTAGVLDVFMEHGIRFDGVIGVSAGAIHGCSYVSGQKGRNLRYYKKYCQDKRFMSFRNWLLTGDFVGIDFCYHQLPEKLDLYDYDAFNNSGMEFYVGCSDLETGKAIYPRLTDMKEQIDYLRASSSLPYVSKTVEIDGRKLLDGGCTDSIPVMAFHRMGFQRQVVVLTRHHGYVKEPERTWMAGIWYRQYPKFVKALKTRHLVYNRNVKKIEALEKAGKLFVIRPSEPLTISRTSSDPKELQQVYEIGRRNALEQLDAMKKWLSFEEMML